MASRYNNIENLEPSPNSRRSPRSKRMYHVPDQGPDAGSPFIDEINESENFNLTPKKLYLFIDENYPMSGSNIIDRTNFLKRFLDDYSILNNLDEVNEDSIKFECFYADIIIKDVMKYLSNRQYSDWTIESLICDAREIDTGLTSTSFFINFFAMDLKNENGEKIRVNGSYKLHSYGLGNDDLFIADYEFSRATFIQKFEDLQNPIAFYFP